MEKDIIELQLKRNREDRMKFVEFWAEFVRNNPDKVWSAQQAVLINSQLRNKPLITKEQYLEIKGELRRSK